MDDNLSSRTKLTEFAPLAPEESEQGVGHLISKLFKLGKNYVNSSVSNLQDSPGLGDDESQDSISSWSTVEASAENVSDTKDDSGPSYQYVVGEGRNLSNVIKWINNLTALRSSCGQGYGETELKQYWIPDKKSKQCYECSEKFTTFRRRHHCRVCGQIFCSQCCNQKIPGKIVGCTGDLRTCTYCCKIVLAHLQSPEVGTQLTSDLRAFQEDLQNKFGDAPNQSPLSPNTQAHSSNKGDGNETGSIQRRISIGYQEEKFAFGRTSSSNFISTEERIKILQNSVSLRNLYEELCNTSTGLILQSHRVRLRSYSNCLLGSELVDWLITQRRASTRVQATAICQALVEAGYLKCLTEQGTFCDGYALYRPQLATCPEVAQPEEIFDSRNQDEPSWMQQVPHESSTTDSEAELPSPEKNYRLPSSSSSFLLDLNFEESTVHLIRPSSSDQIQTKSETDSPTEVTENIVQTSQHRELVPALGWHNARDLRSDNGEQLAYSLLANAYKHHEKNLTSQLLSTNGLSLNWCEVVTPIVHEIVDKIQPDKSHNAVYLDIRHHVQFRKIPGGTRQECKIVEGIVCTKNVAHRGMATQIDNPKILLLKCSLVYQRTEGRLMSLEPIILQEQDYLKNVAARIKDLQPNLVLVQKNVSRLVQDLLRTSNITLVLNVKLSVLERIAKCANADLVTAIDAHISRSKLATCKKFYLKTFANKENGFQKTLMFFEGLPYPHLGATVLLRGGTKTELAKLKHTVKSVLFASYNWRLEKSFLMDEFAQPPNPKEDEFFGDGSSKESSPDFHVNSDTKDKNVIPDIFQQKINADAKKTEHNRSAEEKKLPVKPIEDYSDPLHSYLTGNVVAEDSMDHLRVAELPFSNKFRKALDETILSISPYLQFFIPYLETDSGKKCKLRSFFPAEIYYSKQFLPRTESNAFKNGKDASNESKTPDLKLNAAHPFVSACLSARISDSEDLQGLLANFRACGGRLPHKKLDCNGNQEETVQSQQKHASLDILDFDNHQKIPVLFCSFSPSSNNAPAFCVNPWVVNMYFYGQDDIPLGCFLERYCFRTSYLCQSQTCETPMLHHVRRFVHNSGCVSLSLNTIDCKSNEDKIVMWSWCCKCSAVSPVVPMSSNTWSFSFAKFLELKFYTNVYSRRGTEACQHSLHHDHYQYFGHKNIVASFKYTSIKQWEVSLPPPMVEMKYGSVQVQQTEIIDEIKSLALRGHEVFSIVLEKVSALPTDNDSLMVLKQQLQKEHNVFKSKVEEVQLKLTSPTLEHKKLDEFTAEDVRSLIWPLEDLIVHLKYIISDTIETWNARLLGSRKRDSNIKKDKTLSTHLIEDTDVSENEGTDSKTNESDTVTNEFPASAILQSKKIKSLDHTDLHIETLANVLRLMTLRIDTPIYRSKLPQQRKTCNSLHVPELKLNDFKIDLNFNIRKLSWPLYANKFCSKFDDMPSEKIKKNTSFPPDRYKTIQNFFEVIDDTSTQSSNLPKGHCRSQSDGTVMTQSEDLTDAKKDLKSMKAILAQLLSSNCGITPIQCPFSSQEHHLLPLTSTVSIVVFETELSSIIAYALDSYEYKKDLDEAIKKLSTLEHSSPSPVHKRKALTTSDRVNSTELLASNSEKYSGLLSFLWANQKTTDVQSALLSGSDLSENEDAPTKEKVDAKKSKPPYIEVEFQDLHCNFCCRVYYAERFMWLRRTVIPAGEEAFVRSLCRSVPWNARGGKSGSSFCKTKDDRFILKEMTKQELQQFLDSGNHYFAYTERCISLKLPTLLGKIVGVYQIMYRNQTTNANMRINLLVMENLFYNRTVSHKFDLKGSMRNRLVNPDDQEGEIVLLDENLLKRTCDSPLYIYPHSKAVLTAAIQSDTEFLASQRVMDYSLLVGLDEVTKELVVGIIDYIRTFTWDKKLETMVKKAGILGGQGKLPTIISPEEYRERFIAAMHRYFLQVPDRWTGLGKGLDCQ